MFVPNVEALNIRRHQPRLSSRGSGGRAARNEQCISGKGCLFTVTLSKRVCLASCGFVSRSVKLCGSAFSLPVCLKRFGRAFVLPNTSKCFHRVTGMARVTQPLLLGLTTANGPSQLKLTASHLVLPVGPWSTAS